MSFQSLKSMQKSSSRPAAFKPSYQRVCGIDISKQSLDVHLRTPETETQLKVDYDPQGIQKIIALCLQQQVQIVAVEATGGLQRTLVVALDKAGIALAVINPARIRHFANAEGQLAKTDPLDAQIISLFALRMSPPPMKVRDDQQEKIARLATRRDQLISAKVAEDNRFQQESDPDVLNSIEKHLRWLKKEIGQIDRKLDKLVQASKPLEEKVKIADAMVGIGRVSAVALVVSLPELGRLNRRKIAALAGLAPYNDDSGTVHGKRCIHGGRASVRQALYMPTLTATRYEGKIREMYLRLVSRGKCKMVALTACMRKMLGIINARVAESLLDASTANPSQPTATT